MSLPFHLLTIVACLILTTAACKKDEASKPPLQGELGKEEVAKDKHFASALMQSYEECRAQLAADKSNEIAICATAMAKASRAATAKAPETAHALLKAVAGAADALAGTAADDIEEVRLGFGKVSEAVLMLLTSAPDIGTGYHLFECPMAKGYQRWAQPHAELQNPYMGAKMLSCGFKVEPAQE